MNLIFAGTPDFAADHLSVLARSEHRICAVITQPDKPGKRGKNPEPSAVKRLATELDLAVIQPNRLKAADILHYQADLMVVVAYGQILRKTVLEAPRLGCLNVHASLLPRWRGAAPIQRAILAGDLETGVCIMQMDEGLDTGDVLLRRKVEILSSDTSATLSSRLSVLGSEALLETLQKIDAQDLEPISQNDQGMTYAKKIEKQEAVIDWRAPSIDICRQIKAFNPSPVAFSQLSNMRVRIWDACNYSYKHSHKHTDKQATEQEQLARSVQPGEIISLSKRGLEVACGQGSIFITAIQLPIGKGAILSATDLMNSRKEVVAPGNRFS